MASAKQFYLFFLVFLFSSTSLPIHARDSQLFSKFTRVKTVAANNDVNNNTSSNADIAKETQTPAAEVPSNSKEIPASSGNKKEEKPNEQVQETNGGYGLYGHGSGQFPPTTTTEDDNDDALDAMTYSELPDEENFSEEFSTITPAATSEGGAIDQSKTTKDGYTYNGYEGKQFGSTDAQFTADNVDKNHYQDYRNKHSRDEQQLEKQGMSDTRFLANGRYYYHVEAADPNVNTHINDEYYKHIGGAEFIDRSAVQERNEGSHYGVADRNANNNNGYEGKQFGLSDAQFSTDNVNNNQNNNNYEQQIEKAGMRDTRFASNGQRYDAAAVHNNNHNHNYNNNNKYQPIERQGMSDTRFQENGRYYNAAVNINNNNMYQQGERQGMSDTRFQANGKYYYHVEAANPKVDTHNDDYYKHVDGAEFIDHSADSSRFNNEQQQQQHVNNGGYYNYGTNRNNNKNSFGRQFTDSNSNNNGNSFHRQYSNSNSNYNNVDDENQFGRQGEYIP